MKTLLTPARILLLLLLGSSGALHAQSLGTPAAEVWMGRPLDLTVPARFPNAETTGECVHADVFFGETRVAAGRVRVMLLGNDEQKRVRIVADKPVDEPVVTVSVRAGCRNTITRNYTLLPEMPSESMVAGLVARQQAALNAPLAAPMAATPGATPLRMATSTAPLSSPRQPSPSTAKVAQARAGDAAPRARNAPTFRKEAPSGPRLKLEPLDLDEQPLLRTSTQLAEPAGDASRRATAALLWKAINADPQEILRTSAMLQKLEADLVQLRQTAGQTRSEVAALRRRLDEAQQPWYLSPAMIQVMALLVFVALGAAVLSWHRSRRLAAEHWYEVPYAPPSRDPVADRGLERAALAEDTGPLAPAAAPQAPVRPLGPATIAVAPQPVASPADDGIELAPLDFELPQAAPAPSHRVGGVLRVETLAATFEEVEFLSSLGLAPDAMDVLKAYVQDCASPAPLAYFELMRLCQQHEDAAALATVRRNYGHTFGVDAPRVEQVTAPLGLDSLPALSARITAAWGTEQALDVIEEALFKVPQAGAPTTLQAGRDLLSLHELALRLSSHTAASASSADAQPLAPWAHAEDVATAQAAAQAVADAESGEHFALDVDLGVAPAPLPETQPEPDLAPLIVEMQAAAARDAARRQAARKAEEEDAFSAVMAAERVPVSRF